MLTLLISDRVCVPVDPAKVKEFDPDKVPTLGQLVRELNEAAALAKADASSQEGGEVDDQAEKKTIGSSSFSIFKWVE